MSYRVQLLLYL